MYRLDVLSCKRLLAFRRIATKFDTENKIVRNLLSSGTFFNLGFHVFDISFGVRVLSFDIGTIVNELRH